MGVLGLAVNMAVRLIFLGPPGAGKGTMATLLNERDGVAHVSSGDLLRKAARVKDSIGATVSSLIRQGALVPDGTVTDLVLRHLEGLGLERSLALDGFPRTVRQATDLDAALRESGAAPVHLVIDFEVSTETILARLGGRLVCETCGANYHRVTLPPRHAGLCDRCGGSLKNRPDDEPQTILKRLEVYRQQTAPLLDFYRRQGKIRILSAEGGLEQQYEQLVTLLKAEQLLPEEKE